MMNHDKLLHSILASQELLGIGSRPVLVALSGGADSVALLRALLECGCPCHAAHCNFHLREAESMRDEQFVRELCQRLGVPLVVKDFDVPAWQAEHGGSVEMACRVMRYQWFEQERDQLDCAVIAVAHHADDQVETFFLNLMRGTGLKGLTGMERLNHKIWRPLLAVSRAQILDYLAAIGQDYVTDSTNAHNDYRRNRLRNIVLPVVEQQFEHGRERILDTMANLHDDQELLDDLVAGALPDECHIDAAMLCAHPQASTLLYHRIRHMGFNHEQCRQAVIAVRQGHSGRQFIGQGYIMHVNRQSLDIESASDAMPPIEVPIDLTSHVSAPIRLTVTHNNAPFSPRMCDGKSKVAFSTDILNCRRLVLRHWRRGDRIKPYGMKGSKLVSDVFADLKLDHNAKQNTWLLEADGDILWILGHRASRLYSVDSESQNYLLVSMQ